MSVCHEFVLNISHFSRLVKAQRLEAEDGCGDKGLINKWILTFLRISINLDEQELTPMSARCISEWIVNKIILVDVTQRFISQGKHVQGLHLLLHFFYI